MAFVCPFSDPPVAVEARLPVRTEEGAGVTAKARSRVALKHRESFVSDSWTPGSFLTSREPLRQTQIPQVQSSV